MNVRIKPPLGWAGAYVRHYDALSVGTIIILDDLMYVVTSMVPSIENDVDYFIAVTLHESRWPVT